MRSVVSVSGARGRRACRAGRQRRRAGSAVRRDDALAAAADRRRARARRVDAQFAISRVPVRGVVSFSCLVGVCGGEAAGVLVPVCVCKCGVCV